MNEIDKLFEGLPSEDTQAQDIFDDKSPVTEQVTTEEPIIPEKDDEPHKNRKHRRLEAQLETERTARIQAEARIQALSEVQKFSKGNDDEIDSRWLQMYGDTPETRDAWKLQKGIFKDIAAQAKAEALQEIEERQTQARRKQQEFESLIDSKLEAIEDEFNVDVTSDAPAARKARREFLELVQKLSPKKEDGTLTDYVDFNEAWGLYQLKRNQEKVPSTTERQKEIADRSMAKSNTSSTDNLQEDTQLRYLRSIGIKI